VVRLAARHPELAGAIAQVPMLDGQAAVRAAPPLLSLRFVALGLVDLLRGGKPIYLRTVGAPGEFASMTRDGAHTVTPRIEATAGKPYDNRVAARSMLGMATYRPFKQLRDIRIPTLMVGGTRDTVTPFESGRIAAAGNPQITVAMIDADHFEPYFEPGFAIAVAPQMAFLQRLGLVAEG
jgi:pimeloyl-ACP methyl ester carboxylesterase